MADTADATHDYHDFVTRFVDDAGQLPPGAVVSRFVGIAQVRLPDDQVKLVRLTLDDMDGSTERGLLLDALCDSSAER